MPPPSRSLRPSTDLLVTSPSNPQVKRAHALLKPAGGAHATRRFAGLFAAEGVQITTRALRATDWDIESVLLSTGDRTAQEHDEPGHAGPPSSMTTGTGTGTALADIEDLARARDIPVTHVTAPVFLHLTQRQMPAGAVVIAHRRTRRLDELPGDVPVLVLERPSTPGNIGTIIRTCEAAGLGGVALVGPHADPFSPAAVRSSMGSVFGVPVATGVGTGDLVTWARRSGHALIGTSGGAAQSLWEADLPARSAIVLGNEGAGMTPELQTACDAMVRIPFSPAVDSLNLSAAAAVIAFEYRRRVPVVE